jgi:hypothetical protein
MFESVPIYESSSNCCRGTLRDRHNVVFNCEAEFKLWTRIYGQGLVLSHSSAEYRVQRVHCQRCHCCQFLCMCTTRLKIFPSEGSERRRLHGVHRPCHTDSDALYCILVSSMRNSAYPGLTRAVRSATIQRRTKELRVNKFMNSLLKTGLSYPHTLAFPPTTPPTYTVGTLYTWTGPWEAFFALPLLMTLIPRRP